MIQVKYGALINTVQTFLAPKMCHHCSGFARIKQHRNNLFCGFWHKLTFTAPHPENYFESLTYPYYLPIKQSDYKSFLTGLPCMLSTISSQQQCKEVNSTHPSGLRIQVLKTSRSRKKNAFLYVQRLSQRKKKKQESLIVEVIPKEQNSTTFTRYTITWAYQVHTGHHMLVVYFQYSI